MMGCDGVEERSVEEMMGAERKEREEGEGQMDDSESSGGGE